MTRSSYTDSALYRRLLRQARPYWLHIAGFLLLCLLATPIALLTPLPLKVAVDSVLGSEPPPGPLVALLPDSAADTALLVLTVGLLVVIALLSQLQRIATSLLYTYTGERLALESRAQLFRHAQRLSLLYHDLKGTSDSTYRVLWDAAAIRYIALDGVTPFITAGFTLAAMIYVIFRLDWQLTLVALTVSPVLLVLTRVYRRRLRDQWRDVKKLESGALSVVQEVLAAIRVVKAFGQEEREEDRFVRESSAGAKARIRASLAVDGFGLLIAMTTTLGTAAVLYIGVRHVQAGLLTLGELLIVMAYLAELYSPLKTISKQIGSLQGHLASAERALALLDETPEVIERPQAKALARASGEVILRNVSFAYAQDAPVLRDVSFSVAAGTRVGIAGRTGAGKTTLMSLLTRFYDPTVGQILLDGVDLRDYRLADLRKQFSIVLQEPILFSTTIAENIAYARPKASHAEIVAAAKAANAHDFIASFAEGYDTPVGERGLRLSGGERQRIALARAFLKDAPILILDEPTSSVDIHTEAGIIEAMERLMQGRTTFVVAHRLGTLEHCDLLLVIEGGQLVTITADVSAAIQQASRPGGLDPVVHGARMHA
jgi:ATP-binding cassette subfamily B protein